MNKLNCLIFLVTGIMFASVDAGNFVVDTGDGRSLASSTKDDKVYFNPDSCRQDTGGMVYFAAGEVVFQVPYSDLLYIRGLSDLDRKDLPKRPDISEPEGCPDNPIWGRSFRIRLAGVGMDDGEGAISVNIVARPAGSKVRYDRANEEFERAKSNPKVSCVDNGHGFVACKYPDKKFGVHGEFGSQVYQANHDYYKTPLGERFAISCSALLMLDENEHRCEVAYDVNSRYSIFYNFYRSAHPISRATELDKKILDFLRRATVKNYQWSR